MKKLGVYAITAVGATAVSMAFFGSGVAAADDYSGQTYGDASKAISDAGKKAVIASRAGDTLTDDNCIVTHSQSAPWIKGDDFAPVTDTVLVYLNCNATVATAKDPGNSAASPEGKAAMQKAQEDKSSGSG
ncbi:MAG TPA: hypothetical protein VFC01_29345 [Mycobacterium sp.]|nr:hypothetical protein [Mycobacterium sp.]